MRRLLPRGWWADFLALPCLRTTSGRGLSLWSWDWAETLSRQPPLPTPRPQGRGDEIMSAQAAALGRERSLCTFLERLLPPACSAHTISFSSLDKQQPGSIGSHRLALWSCFGFPPSGPGACLRTGARSFKLHGLHQPVKPSDGCNKRVWGTFRSVSFISMPSLSLGVGMWEGRKKAVTQALGTLCQPSAVWGETPSVDSFSAHQGGCGRVALSPGVPQNRALCPCTLNSQSHTGTPRLTVCVFTDGRRDPPPAKGLQLT